MPTARRSARRSTATQPFSPSAEAARPQLKSRAATPRRSSSKKARTPSPAPARSRSPSPSPAAASPAPAPASAASYRAYRTYLSESEFADAPAASWVPSILGLPSTDLLSLEGLPPTLRSVGHQAFARTPLRDLRHLPYSAQVDATAFRRCPALEAMAAALGFGSVPE